MSTYIQVVQHLKPGGIETMALDLCRMHKQGETGYVVSLEGRRDEALANWPKLQPYAERIIFLDKKPGWQPSIIKRLVDLMNFFAISSVHTHHIGPLLYAGIAARFAGIRNVIHTEHDAWHLQDDKRCRLQRWVLRLVKPALVADAKLVARDMSARLGLADGRVHVIQNGINTDRFRLGSKSQARAQLQLPANTLLVGSAGRLELEKGHAVLVEALASMNPAVHLAIAGDGSQAKALKAQCRALGVEKRVHFLGSIDQMPAFYQALDVFCLPSFNEGLSLVLLEAQACGVPAVVTDVGASHEALCPATGRLVAAGAPKQLADSLTATLASTEQSCPRQFVRVAGDGKVMATRYATLRNSYAAVA
ncbi:glycosyltransferase [Neiella sp. HB171785]|uniref:Glycosyltransferase n=1 Tax=Neiella litorisoli TaxID=2771431 RepID=A0A8J6QLX9_9GAMM|nr:glycosyltransferase [Neiella litorisoli]MBD1390762.1 glycosyltransferase [Neiella litorisoli]